MGRLKWRILRVHEDLFDPLRTLEIKQAIRSDAEDAVADIVAAVFRKSDQVMPGLWAE
jgi:hypothetical protein